MTVCLTASDGTVLQYVFDVFARRENCRGDSFCLTHRWVLRDVYPVGEKPSSGGRYIGVSRMLVVRSNG